MVALGFTPAGGEPQVARRPRKRGPSTIAARVGAAERYGADAVTVSVNEHFPPVTV